MRVAVVGANGQLGNEVVQAFARRADSVFSLTHSDIEISDLDSVVCCLKGLRPDVVVNAAAMHHVEKCELDPERAYATNVNGAAHLAQICHELGAVLVHVSTDYVFDGKKNAPYVEDDAPCPLNAYGSTKLAGEAAVISMTARHFIVRTSALYGSFPCRAKGGENFVQLMLRLARERGFVRVVDSETVTPTSCSELSAQIVALTETDAYGLYHATAEGSCSWFDFAETIFRLAGVTTKLSVAGALEFSNKTPRPSYSVLENKALKAIGLNRFGAWQVGLEDYVRALEATPV